LESAAISYAIIGGHAVNTWLEPRFTADVDLTVAAGPEDLMRMNQALEKAGYSIARQHGATLPSGPDFVRWLSGAGDVVEVQVAKTDLQREVVRRAIVAESGARIATKEDLIVLKLIADRPKDRIDLEGLCALDGNDWSYVERWAREWDVVSRLERFRAPGDPGA
jgi:hypothetical protein